MSATYLIYVSTYSVSLHLDLSEQELLDDAESCRRKMSNATQLIDGLSGERIRWTEASKSFADQVCILSRIIC